MDIPEHTMKTARLILFLLFVHLLTAPVPPANGMPAEEVSPQERCPVCGMFVAKYPNWIAQIQYDGRDEIRFFDGVKDMMVYYFDPGSYGGPAQKPIRNLFVKDYYTLDWLQAGDAHFVVGSDVYGPMGHELIPFGTVGAAESFLKDHHGRQVLTFEQITPELIDSLRAGQKMR